MDRRDPWLPWKVGARALARRARWALESHRYAGGTRRAAQPVLLARHGSRVVRDPRRAVLELAEGKAVNLSRAAAALDGVVVRPGELLSFWYLVGAPSAERGFVEGMELRSGCIVPSVGGGLCQLAGGLFEVVLRAGLSVVEHHPHSLELAPEPDRIRPFGTGAAVLYPYRDVAARNDHPFPVVLGARVSGGELVLELSAPRDPEVAAELEERRYRVERRAGRLVRAGELWRVWRHCRSGRVERETIVLARAIPVLEELPDSHCWTCHKGCVNRRVEGTPERERALAELRRLRVVPG